MCPQLVRLSCQVQSELKLAKLHKRVARFVSVRLRRDCEDAKMVGLEPKLRDFSVDLVLHRQRVESSALCQALASAL